MRVANKDCIAFHSFSKGKKRKESIKRGMFRV